MPKKTTHDSSAPVAWEWAAQLVWDDCADIGIESSLGSRQARRC